MKHKIYLGLIALGINALAQTPTGFPSGTYFPSVATSTKPWNRGGNLPVAAGATDNIFGTFFNSPVYHYTDGLQRMQVGHKAFGAPLQDYPGSLTNPLPGNRLTRVTISRDGAIPITRPLSLLTLGYNFPLGSTQGGYRWWQDIGTSYSSYTDNMYVGLREKSLGDPTGRTSVVQAFPADYHDAVVSWGDNFTGIPNPATPVNDNLTFLFHTGNNGSGLASSEYGREIMRMIGEGNVGIGPVFYDNAQPTNMLHINADNSTPAFMQVTNKTPTGQTVNDGFHFGVTTTGMAVVNQKENLDMRFYTFNQPRAVIKNTGWIGFNTLAPGNELEISSRTTTPYALTGSGLRFTNLKSTNTTIPNGVNGVNSLKLLTVDKNGDVVLTDAVAGTSLGNLCGSPTPNPLLNNWEVPMNSFNLNHTMPIFSNSQVNIGFPSCITNSARIAVFNDTLRAAGGFTTQGAFQYNAKGVVGVARNFDLNTGLNLPGAIGVTGIAEAAGQADIIGVLGQSIASAVGNSYGGYFEARNSIARNIGTKTDARGSGTAIGLESDAIDGIFVNIGVSGTAFNSSSLIPLTAISYPGGVNIGIYGRTHLYTATAPSYAGYFDGDVFINGAGNSPTGMFTLSDQNIKSNVATVSKPLDLLLKLRPVSYNLNNSYAPQLNVDTTKTFGLIAQEVAVLFPTLVKDIVVPAMYDSLGSVTTPSVALKSLNYTGLIPLTISAIQDINSRQNKMQSQISQTGLSDALVKTNINNFNALAKIKTLNPVSYNFTNASVPQLTFTPQLDYGFVAQQIQTVYPELVDTLRIPAKYDSLGAIVNVAQVLKTVNYKAMSALLTRAIQEQQTKIDSLIHVTSKQDSINNAVQTQISNLTSMINACCSNPGAKTSNPSINQLDVELSDKDAIVLEQNVPNPFAEQTTITYNVPTSVNKAQLLFFNATGQVIQTVDIKTRGKGKVNVFASDLSSGLYHYTLVADGKVVDSKKMVRE